MDADDDEDSRSPMAFATMAAIAKCLREYEDQLEALKLDVSDEDHEHDLRIFQDDLERLQLEADFDDLRLEEELEDLQELADLQELKDNESKESIGAHDRLKMFIYNLKNQINEKDKLAEKLKHDEKDKLETVVKKALEWMKDNQTVDKEDYEEKLKEVEAVCNHVLTTVYQRSGDAPVE
ncbi:hypothetical protein ACLB2K_023388 [Fragaria x ananassa]